jgi:lipopolysaccharide/colanic/teichoic acid biosynthesis glycosyltransferase
MMICWPSREMRLWFASQPQTRFGIVGEWMTSRIYFDPNRSWRLGNDYLERKRRWCRITALPMAAVLTPIILGLWLLVRVTSRGPGFYSQVRLGRHGKPFRIIKLRTMQVDAERGVGAVWSSENDPRVTWVGRVLRKTHLDELPQIFNVVRGEMCFVGPRPERPEIVEKLAPMVPNYVDRLAMPPGVTGMAQLHLPADKSVECVFKKLGFDFTYMERASLGLDLLVCIATAFKPLPIIGGWLCATISGSPEFIRDAYAAGIQIQRLAVKPTTRAPKPTPVMVEP